MLLLVVALFSIWLGVHTNRAHKQRLAVRAIREYGGSVQYDFEYDGFSKPPKRNARPDEPSWLVDLVGLDFLSSVWSVNLVWSVDAHGKRTEAKATEDIVVQLDR